MIHTNTQPEAAGAIGTTGPQTDTDANASDFTLVEVDDQAIAGDCTLVTTANEARIDSRWLAQHLHNKHQSLFELIKNHRADFEELGLLRFQTGKATGGRPERFAMLNEDQSTLALSYSKNTPRVRQLKVMLVKAFGEARRAADMRRTEYLPSYHRLSDSIHAAAAGSANEKHVHANVARLLNKTVGIESGQRRTATVPQQAFMIVAQEMAARAMQSANDHHDGYQRVKLSMLALAECTKLQVGHG
jgi:phage regulator Rha-like protein